LTEHARVAKIPLTAQIIVKSPNTSRIPPLLAPPDVHLHKPTSRLLGKPHKSYIHCASRRRDVFNLSIVRSTVEPWFKLPMNNPGSIGSCTNRFRWRPQCCKNFMINPHRRELPKPWCSRRLCLKSQTCSTHQSRGPYVDVPATGNAYRPFIRCTDRH
jgi:hypothetical protein